MSDTIVGKILDELQERDAIHIAVACVIADELLMPGQPIGFDESAPDQEHVIGAARANAIGIVDPFLHRAVNPGQRFWMFLFPQTITGLKHVWTHPAFPEGQQVAPLPKSANVAFSEAWLRDFIAGADCPDYDTVINAAINGTSSSWDEDYLHFDGYDAHGTIPDLFWDHIEVVTGKKPKHRAKYFSCSC
jgi:hypothetical protein